MIHTVDAPRTVSVKEAFEILDFNQNLVQFADSKANTLIVINSIALATVAAQGAVPVEWQTVVHILRLVFLLTCVASILACFSVVVARTPDEARRRPDLIFFGDILQRKSEDSYAYDYTHTSPDSMLEDVLRRSYRVASIAARKFRQYAMAQTLTVAACSLWLVAMMVSLGLSGVR